jgi:hypothetical protein
MGFFAVSVMVIAVAWGARRTGPRWLWWTGAPLAVLLWVPFVWWVTAKLCLFWVIGLSVSLTRDKRWGASPEA